MKTTQHFEERLRKRGLSMKAVEEALEREEEREVQDDGRICIWGRPKGWNLYLRVVVLPDGETMLTAFPDSDFTRKQSRK